ncbi:hypothetical protein BN1095_6650002 [Clostridioides difficile]|uniref:Uncharacterized protein n=1 Tax=Clostridioides difficile TaxID=1496 RepID=A0A069AUS9_CLODI|nr:hypothetical protein BN1095_6650002 [Clostridioides difficile]
MSSLGWFSVSGFRSAGCFDGTGI